MDGWDQMTADGTNVFSPLCVAHPLAKKSASVYWTFPAGKMSMDPKIVRLKM